MAYKSVNNFSCFTEKKGFRKCVCDWNFLQELNQSVKYDGHVFINTKGKKLNLKISQKE